MFKVNDRVVIDSVFFTHFNGMTGTIINVQEFRGDIVTVQPAPNDILETMFDVELDDPLLTIKVIPFFAKEIRLLEQE